MSNRGDDKPGHRGLPRLVCFAGMTVIALAPLTHAGSAVASSSDGVDIARSSAHPRVVASSAGGSHIPRYSAIVRVDGDGSLQVTEAVTYDFNGVATETVQRVIVSREHYDAENDRVYDLTDVTVNEARIDATAQVTSNDSTDTITVRFAEPQAEQVTVRFGYRVHGAVAQTADGLEVRWPIVQGFDAPIAEATVEWNAPEVLWLLCLTGAPGSSKPCTTAQLVESPTPTMTERDLPVGDEMVGILGLGAGGGVVASADFQARWSLARGFTVTGSPLWVALGVLMLGLLAAVGLWWTRGRDSRADEGGSSSPLVDVGEGGLAFAPPSGVRPGQMGTLVDERADIIDISSTIVDLAVRNYLFIEELPHDRYDSTDWLLRRRNDPGDELLPYEREIFDALFSTRAEVKVSELAGQLPQRLPGVQALMYADMVEQGWFGERPDSVRSRWTTAGWVLVAAGAVLTVVLALVSTFGLVGLAVILAGVALAAAGQLAPARTPRGGQVLRELRRFRAYLEVADVDVMPEEQREELISRFYPYALVFGLGERWATALAAIDNDDEPDEPIYWYGAPSDWHLSDAAPSLLRLSTTLSAVLASRRLLSA